MPRKTKAPKARNGSNGATLGFEAKLWLAADKLRNNMDAAEYKHVVLGLIFLKYISDAFEEQHAKLVAERDSGADPEDPDEYRAVNVFWVPREARWAHLQANAKQPTIGRLVDDAMVAIERDNPTLKGVLPKDYARPALDKQRLGELIDLIATIGLGDADNRSKDILGRVYEYFLAQFASAEGKKGGQFYTPRCVVQLLVAMLAPYRGRVYDPCCGSGGMFVQSEKFIEEHGGKIGDISVYGQESNATTWRLAKMNLAIRGIDANLGPEPADSFHRDLHPDLKADYVLANPPFNSSDWGGERLRDDKRWKYGVPPVGNANFAWVEHFIHHLNPTGLAGFVLANGSMSSNTSGEGEIRKNIVEADLVDCMVALPGQLFYSTQIPVCLWFLARDRRNSRFRDRRGQVLFIDARKMGTMIDRVHRELTEDDIQKIADTYHAWRGDGVEKGTVGSTIAGAHGGAPSRDDGADRMGNELARGDAPRYDDGDDRPANEWAHSRVPLQLGGTRSATYLVHHDAPVRDDGDDQGIDESAHPHGSAHNVVGDRPGDVGATAHDVGGDRPGHVGAHGRAPSREGGGDPPANQCAPLPEYRDVAGFCKSATIDEIRAHGHILTPGRYVGTEEIQHDGEPFEEKMGRLVDTLREQTDEAAKLDKAIWENLRELGYVG